MTDKNKNKIPQSDQDQANFWQSMATSLVQEVLQFKGKDNIQFVMVYLAKYEDDNGNEICFGIYPNFEQAMKRVNAHKNENPHLRVWTCESCTEV